ncbi:MAG: DUF2493 domain-containing protein [Peptostreptococcaceae bacterium]
MSDVKKGLKVIVAGSRGIEDYQYVRSILDKIITEDDEIVSGMAKGIDSLAVRYAKEKGKKLHEFPADWGKHGKRAGYLRNEEMGKFADTLVAIWDGESKGTGHMIDIMRRLGKSTAIVVRRK